MALSHATSRPMLQQRSHTVKAFASAATTKAAAPPSLARRIQSSAAAAVVATGLLVAPPAFAADGVSFAGVSAGATVASPVHVAMNVTGLKVQPAADGLQPGSGHFHIYIDVPKADQEAEGEAIPFTDNRKHFGKGQQEADLELSLGKHTLTLQFANALHESYGPKYSSSITLNVK